MTNDPLQGVLANLSSGDAGGAIASLAQAGVQTVTVRSAFTPDFSFSPFAPGAPAGGGQPAGAPAAPVSPWLAWLQPEVTIQGAFGVQQWAPAGSPQGSYVPQLVGAGAIAFGVLALLLGNAPVAKLSGFAGLAFLGVGEAERRGWLS